MSNSRVRLGGLTVDLPGGWSDVTSDLENPTAPLTLATANGVGALQLSVARYRAGPNPGISTSDLANMLADFAKSKQIHLTSEVKTTEGKIKCVAANFNPQNDFLRVWYCSDGQNVVLATYVCSERDRDEDELKVCEEIINSIQFHDQAL